MDFETQQELNELRYQIGEIKQRLADIIVMLGATTNGYYDLKVKLQELIDERKTGQSL